MNTRKVPFGIWIAIAVVVIILASRGLFD